MIVFNSSPTSHEEPFQEAGMIDAVFKAADIDADKIRDTWKDSDKGIYDKIKVTNDDGIQKVKNIGDTIDSGISSKNRVDTRSIIARAKNSVIQFPIYITQTSRVNEAHIISKMFERVYTSLIQTVLSQNPIINEDEANDLVFLKRFHTNIKEAADVLVNKYYKPIDDIDCIMQESVFYTQKITENCTVEFSVIPTIDQDLILENARLLNEPLSGFMYLKEADDNDKNKEVRTATETQIKNNTVSNDELMQMALNRAQDEKKITAEEIRLINKSHKEIVSEVDADNQGASTSEKQIEVYHRLDMKRKAERKADAALEKLKEDIKDGNVPKFSFRDGRYIRTDNMIKTSKQVSDKHDKVYRNPVDLPVLLKETDIKKINGLLPYEIQATFRLRTKEGLDRDVRYIIGVKSVLHLIRTQDLADDLRELVTGNIKSLQKVRYKTGEINFMDYMFNIKGIKNDAAKHINYNKRWINTLKRLAEYDKMNNSYLKKPIELITKGDVPIPNGTLVLSQPDVTTLANQTGIDLSIVSNAKRLAKNLFLIAVVIIDSSAGSMRVLFPDSDNNWDVQSLASIDAEISKTDNSQLMRELNQMVNKR